MSELDDTYHHPASSREQRDAPGNPTKIRTCDLSLPKIYATW